MGKTVWIINQYASTPANGMGGRHYYLARELVELGHRVYVFCSASHHLLRDEKAVEGLFEVEQVEGINYVWVNMPSYSHAHSKKRALGWFLFAWRLLRVARQITVPPDAVLYSSPSLIPFLTARRIAHRCKSRLVFEVRDIWPLTLTTLGGASSRHPFIRLMQHVEDLAYKTADTVISNLANAVEHMAERGMDADKFIWIPNGFSYEEATGSVMPGSETANFAEDNVFTVGYVGTLGHANAIPALLSAAEMLKDYKVEFVLVGGGRETDELRRLAAEKGLDRVKFVAPVPKSMVHAVMKTFDACYIGWRNAPIYRFGVGANKIPEYLYAGKPIIHAYSGRCDPVAECGAGVTVPAEDPAALAEAIISLIEMSPSEREELGSRGRQYALDHYEYRRLAKKLESALLYPCEES